MNAIPQRHPRMQFSFTERADYEAGFAQVFHDQIVPILEVQETRRQGLARKAKLGMTGTGALTAGGIGGGLGFDSTLGMFAGIGGVVGTIGVGAYFQNEWKGGLGADLFPILCGFLEGVEYGQQEISLDDFKRLGLVPSYDEVSMEDPITGTHDGFDFAMSEVTLKTRTRDSKGNTTTRIQFRGLLFSVQIIGPAPRIFFGKDRGSLMNWFSESFSGSRIGLEKVALDNAAFERIYEVYASDAVAARHYINDALMSGLIEIARAESTKRHVACAIEGDRLYLALPRRGDFLGLASLFRPVTAIEEDLHDALADLTLPNRLIERLQHG